MNFWETLEAISPGNRRHSKPGPRPCRTTTGRRGGRSSHTSSPTGLHRPQPDADPRRRPGAARSGSDGRTVQEVLGDDIPGFCTALAGGKGARTYRGRREQLNRNVARILSRLGG